MAHTYVHLHEHELISEDEKKLDTDDVKMKECGICGFLMFVNPYYRCEKGCDFFVHKQCAEELPQRTDFSFDSTTHHLSLIPIKVDPNRENDIRCTKCFQICNNFVYSSLGRFRSSYFHPFCVSPKEIKTKHRSHHDHPMTPTYKMISAVCDACGKEDKDHFLSCQVCNYWIHKECALLPSIGMHEDHPLILLYSNPFSKENPTWGDCNICQQDIPIENAVYMSQACSYFVHLKCVKSKIKPLTQEESGKQIIDLPPGEKEYEVFPSVLIQNEVKEVESKGVITKWMTPEECHENHNHHSLILHRKDDHHETSAGVCNACIRPISTSYYKCSSETVCPFIVHESCAKLPKTIPKKFDDEGMHLFREWTSNTLRAFICDICERRCNGFGYSSDEEPGWWSFVADVECASAPRIIKHESHNHILHLIQSSAFDYTQIQHFSCCTSDYTNFLYMCFICDLKIHISCALLPKKVSHEFDDHPLQLITNNNNTPKKEDHFCEFCEEDIDPNIWFYNCDKCHQSFHVNCIPSVGELSKFKFGGTIDGVSHSSHPHSDHPLTSVRMLTVGTQTCGVCDNTIDGFEDGVAFQCSTCDFWIHSFCIRN